MSKTKKINYDNIEFECVKYTLFWESTDDIRGCRNPRNGTRRLFNYTNSEVVWVDENITRDEYFADLRQREHSKLRFHQKRRAQDNRARRIEDLYRALPGYNPHGTFSTRTIGTVSAAGGPYKYDFRKPWREIAKVFADAKINAEEAAERQRLARIKDEQEFSELLARTTSVEVNGKTFTRPELEEIWEEEYLTGIKRKGGGTGQRGRLSRRNAEAEAGAFLACRFYWRDVGTSRGSTDRNTTFSHTGVGPGWNDSIHRIAWHWCQEWHKKFTKRSDEEYRD